jgi:rhamnose transport system substrate-binding protein
MTRYDRRRLRTMVAALAALAMVAVLAACGSTKSSNESSSGGAASSGSSDKADPNAPLKKGLKIVSMPKQLGNPYEEIEHGGVDKAAKEMGDTHRMVGPTDAGASSQVPLINSVTQQKPDAFIIAGNDPNAVAPALKQMAQRGIKVVGMDSDVAPDARQIFINQASSEEIGRDEIRLASKQIGGKGQIAVLSATANATNQNTWIKFMKDELTKPEYKDIKLVKVAYGDDDDQKSFQETQGLLQAYPDLKAIIAPTTVGIAAAARYICGSRYEGKVMVTGLGTPNQMRKFVKSGCVKGFELWNPEDVGYLAAYAAGALVSGQITGKEGESFKAGKLGTKKVGADGEVILGPPTRFTKSNIDDFHF